MNLYAKHGPLNRASDGDKKPRDENPIRAHDKWKRSPCSASNVKKETTARLVNRRTYSKLPELILYNKLVGKRLASEYRQFFITIPR